MPRHTVIDRTLVEKAHDGHRGLALSASECMAGVVRSPYWHTDVMSRVGAGRDIHSSLTSMKVDVINLTPNECDFAFYNDSTPVPGTGFCVLSLTEPYTWADKKAAAIAGILTYASTHSLSISASDIIFPGDPAPAVESAITLSLQTNTGAVGTQVSATRDAFVIVDASMSTTASIAGNAAGDLVLEVAPTNSATPGDWVIKGRTGNSQALSLAITLQSVQIVKGQMVAFVPKGYYVKLRSTGISGTATGAFVEARQVLM